jgi:putative oxidoreductase
MMKLPSSPDLALLLLRVGTGAFMAINHGWPKLSSFTENADKFADPLGVSPPVSLALAIVGELVCPLLLLCGLATRVAAVLAAITMSVAAFGAHADAPLTKGEHALLYAVVFTALAVAGGGRFTLDRLLFRARAT